MTTYALYSPQVLDSTADGYVRGESCRALWVQGVAEEDIGSAVASGALAVIKSTSVNTNGKASSLTAPHGPTQQVRRAADNAP